MPQSGLIWENCTETFNKERNGTLEDVFNRAAALWDGRCAKHRKNLTKMVQDGCEIIFKERLYGDT